MHVRSFRVKKCLCTKRMCGLHLTGKPCSKECQGCPKFNSFLVKLLKRADRFWQVLTLTWAGTMQYVAIQKELPFCLLFNFDNCLTRIKLKILRFKLKILASWKFCIFPCSIWKGNCSVLLSLPNDPHVSLGSSRRKYACHRRYLSYFHS